MASQKFTDDPNILKKSLDFQSLPSQALLYPKINGAKNRQKIKGYEDYARLYEGTSKDPDRSERN